MIDVVNKNKRSRFVQNHQCPSCKNHLSGSFMLCERIKCKKCENFFFFVKVPEKFFVLS